MGRVEPDRMRSACCHPFLPISVLVQILRPNFSRGISRFLWAGGGRPPAGASVPALPGWPHRASQCGSGPPQGANRQAASAKTYQPTAAVGQQKHSRRINVDDYFTHLMDRRAPEAKRGGDKSERATTEQVWGEGGGGVSDRDLLFAGC